jgi:acetyl esterase
MYTEFCDGSGRGFPRRGSVVTLAEDAGANPRRRKGQDMNKLGLLWAFALARAPEPLAALALTGRRRVVQGRRIDAKAQALGQLSLYVRPPDVDPDLEDSRRGLKMLALKFDEPCPPLAVRRDVEVPGAEGPLPARIYDASGDATARPTLLFVHGGGWVQGDLDTHDGLCGKLAAWAGIRVISIAYRLAPEHRFPAAPDDVLACYRALRAMPGQWGVNPDRIAVGGDSAGGNLTAALMHDLQTRGLPLPAAQLLIYPAVDTRMNSASMQALRDAYILPVRRIEWYLDQYLPAGQDRADPRVAPLFSDRLAGQPPALIVVGGHDPLRDDGVIYADALRRAGVAAELVEFEGQVHAFVSVTRAIPQGNAAIRTAAGWLKSQIG